MGEKPLLCLHVCTQHTHLIVLVPFQWELWGVYCRPAVVGSLHCTYRDSVKAPVLVCCGHVSFVCCVCIHMDVCVAVIISFQTLPEQTRVSEGRKGLVKSVGFRNRFRNVGRANPIAISHSIPQYSFRGEIHGWNTKPNHLDLHSHFTARTESIVGQMVLVSKGLYL